MATLDGLTVLDWLLRLSNLLGLIVLFGVARRIGRFEEKQEQLNSNQGGVSQNVGKLSEEIKSLSRLVYQISGSLSTSAPTKVSGRFPL